MGNEQSRKATTSANVEIELNHSRMHFVRVINDSRQRHMQAIFSTQKNDYIKWATLLMSKKLNSNHLLLPISYQYQAGEFCGTSGQAKINYQNYPYLLQQQIENRRHKKRRFDQTQLWLLLYCLLEAQKQMRTYTEGQQGVGDVRPQNVFLNEQGLVKVACGWSWPKESNNYQKFLENQVTYLAPQDLPLLEQQKVENSQNTKSETFSIGLTILSAATQRSYNNLYSLSSKRFNIQQFTHILNQWRLNEFYSDIFKATLGSMLEVDLARRIDEKAMYGWIEKYRDNILARKDFVINDPPQAIIDQVHTIKGLYETVTGSRFGVASKLQGSRRVVVGESRQFVPSFIPPPLVHQQQPSFINNGTESAYTSVDNRNTTHLSNYLIQGAPITTNAPVFINRTSVPNLYSQTKNLTESVYTRNYNSIQQNQPQIDKGNPILSMGKMNFQYNTFGQQQQQNQQSPQKNEAQTGQLKSLKGTQKKIPHEQQQNVNQPEVVQNPRGQQQAQGQQ